jgi:hypothetical protein
MPKKKRPVAVSTTGDRWVPKRSGYDRGYAKYNPGQGPAPVETILLERFADKAMLDELKSPGGLGKIMQLAKDVYAAGNIYTEGEDTYISVLAEGNHLWTRPISGTQNIQLPKGSFYAGTQALSIRRQRGRTGYVLNDHNPVVKDYYIVMIDGDLYAMEDLRLLVSVDG